MKKVIRIDENQLINIIERVVKEQDEEKFKVEPQVGKIPREKQLQGVFGEYNDQIPNNVLRYMRKNPQLIMNRLAKIYGNNFLKYADKAHKNANK
jgi:hypothetical protein